ncbi:hypothetical protein K377_08049 [Streptomyces sp. PsTaAH-137]|nr:hypothetical protein [Streptomyces sp. SID8367]RAJ69473.1 hypothetical protein K377_08049 [Streptomyces sp. PsTaAH-137]
MKTGQMPKDAGGSVFVLLGFVLVAVGITCRGRVLRPLSAKRAQAAGIRERSRNLLCSAEMAIADARRRAASGEPVIVTVDDVATMACQHYGYVVEREQAAAVLRDAFEADGGHSDCMTDAFD